MLLLGLLLIAAAGTFTGLLIADNLSGGPEYQATVLGHDLVTLNSLGVFLAGAALALLFCLGLALVVATRRRRRVTPRAAHRAARRPGRSAARDAELVDPAEEPAAVLPPERAAQQGGADTDGPVEVPAGGRRRHLFGH
ncbi:hypothetical protein OH807_02875 [Kitasatospora sp. NBC_01560]|uniref:hypothetical protein n=1 Tax=Kitasatospora sp. NBC_01560 TaxID=2975965 RepID=UPI0038682AC8